MNVQVKLQELMLATVYDLMLQIPGVDSKEVLRRKKAMFDEVDLTMKQYEAELYQDRYAPSYQREERERQRELEQKQAEYTAREAIARKKVAAFSDDP